MAERFRLQAVEAGLLAGKSIKQIAKDAELSTRQVYLAAQKLEKIQHAQLFSGKSRGAVALLSRTRKLIETIEAKLDEPGSTAGESWAMVVDRLMAAHHREAQCIAALAGEQVEVTQEGALERLRSDLREMGAESLGLGGGVN